MKLRIFKGLPIGDAAKRAMTQARINAFNTDVDLLCEQMYTGQISLGAWQEEMKALIRGVHTGAAAIAKGGWDEMVWKDWARLGNPLKAQYRYLAGFAEHVGENRDSITLKAIQARAHMYGEAAGVSGNLIAVPGEVAQALPFMPKDGSTKCLVNCQCRWELAVIDKTKDFQVVQATWRMGVAEHCDDCYERDGYVAVIRVGADVEVPSIIGGV